MVLESVLGGAVAGLTVLMLMVWVLRTIVAERVRVVSSTGPADAAPLPRRRVRQLDYLLVGIGTAFLLTAAGYVTLGVLPA